MRKRFELQLTEEQLVELGKRTKAAGFTKKADYIRFVLLAQGSIMEKIDTIYREVCDGAREKKKQATKHWDIGQTD